MEGLVSYNLSPNAYQQVKHILEELLDLEVGHVWKQTFENNVKAARLIRQGFEYCVVNKEEVGERLAELKSKIRIKVTNEYVIAERKFTALTPINKLEAVREKSFVDKTTFNEVLTTVLANLQLSKMSFPHFVGDENAKRLIDRVVKEHGYRVYIEDENSDVELLWVIKDGESGNKKEHSD